MNESKKPLLSLGMIGASCLGSVPMCDLEKTQQKAMEALHNMNMKGGYIPAKKRKRLESHAGIGDVEVEKLVAKPKIKRNAPCPCGSRKKYKKCCGV